MASDRRSARTGSKKHVKAWLMPKGLERLVLVIVAFAVSALAQQFGEITGTTMDASGAVIVGALVSVTNTATQQVRNVTSNESGVYTVPYLVPGTYSLRVEKAGFKVSTSAGVEVHVDDVIRADFRLELGEVSQQIEVTGAVQQLNTESAALGSVIASRQIVDLPLNGRDYLSLVSLSSNASAEQAAPQTTSLQGGTRALSVITIAGQRVDYNHYTLDGTENTDPNFNSYIIHPSVDAIQEFKVQTGVYSAEFGRGASQINVNTIAGTNAYHGAAFEFLRNSDLDAKAWGQAGPKNPFRRNDYGFTLAGPVSIPKVFSGKNRLFFMSNFENLRDVTVVQNKSSVAPDAMRAGNFSLTPGVQIIYDPSTRVYPSSGSPSAVPFSGNIIPASRISPQAAILQSDAYYPRQNVPGNASLLNNFIYNSPTVTKAFQFNQRIDWVENSNSTWFGRYSKGDDALNTGGAFFDSGTLVPTDVRQAVLANTRVLSPRIVNEARFAWNEFDNFINNYYSNKTNIQATLGIQGLVAPDPLSWGLPTVGTNFNYPSPTTPYITHDDSFQGVEGLSIVKGSHSIKIGGELRRMRYNEYGNSFSTGSFSFDGGSTCNPASCTAATGYAYADFLLGLPSTAVRITAEANGMMRATYYAGYFEDDWKVTRKLTLNVGLRYENERPWVDKYNGLINPQITSWGVGLVPGNIDGAYVLPNAASTVPIFTRPGNKDFYQNINLRFANQPVQNGNQMGPGLVNPSNKNFGPRIGVAYSPWTHWSIRAGYGIFYVQDIGETEFDMARNRGGKDQNVIANNNRTTTLTSPWASEAASASCPGYTGVCLVAPQLLGVYQGNTTPYVEQYMFVLQRELTQNTVMEIGYLGNQGHHLDRLVILNQAVEKTGPTDQSSIASRRPWPLLGPIQLDMDTVSSNYSSLEGKLTRRLDKGLTYSAAFTWSRSIDGGSATRGGPQLWPYNSYNLEQERGPSDFNEKYRFVGNAIYELPFGVGKNHLNHGMTGALLGGWQLGNILTAYTGLPLNGPGLGDTASLGLSEGNTGNFTGISPVPATRTPSHWWNAAAFDLTNPVLSYRVGNEGRNALQGIGALTLNSSLSRIIRIKERQQFNIRIDAFNTLNQANYLTPSTNYLVPSTFGVVVAAQTMRQLQLSLKYSF